MATADKPQTPLLQCVVCLITSASMRLSNECTPMCVRMYMQHTGYLSTHAWHLHLHYLRASSGCCSSCLDLGSLALLVAGGVCHQCQQCKGCTTSCQQCREEAGPSVVLDHMCQRDACIGSGARKKRELRFWLLYNSWQADQGDNRPLV